MVRARSLIFLGVAACAGGASRAPADPGCPPAGAVALAMWDVPDEGGPGAFQVRLGFRGAEDPTAPAPGPVPAYTIAKLGLGPLPGELWLLQPGLPPCRAQVAGYQVERLDVGPVSLMVSATLTGCAPVDATDNALAWVTLDGREPTACRLEVPRLVGARRAVPTADGVGIAVAPETAATALPAAWAPFAPAEPCDGCERLWEVTSTATAPVASDVIITDLRPGPDACGVEYDDRAGLFVTPAGGAPVEIVTAGTPLALVGALVDGGGTRVILTASVDRWATVDVDSEGRVGASRTVQYYVASEEDGLVRSMAPYCGP